MGILKRHLDDAGLAEVWTDRTTTGVVQADRASEIHLQACGDCRARYAAFAGWLDTLRADAVAEADVAFGAERLSVQQAQILRRLEALEHPARVIAFPRFARPISAANEPRRRWVAAAAAAGLFLGVGLGQLLELGQSGGVRQPDAVTERQIARGTMPGPDAGRMGLPAAAQVSDEVFLYDQDPPSSQVRVPESLQYLNAITPGARDYDPR